MKTKLQHSDAASKHARTFKDGISKFTIRSSNPLTSAIASPPERKSQLTVAPVPPVQTANLSTDLTGATGSTGSTAPPVGHGRTSLRMDQCGKYEPVWELSRDVISKTYAAKCEGVDKLLALRIFNARTNDSSTIRGIHKAAVIASELTHNNIVPVYDTGSSSSGAPYIVSEWIEGQSLADLFKEKARLDIQTFLDYMSQICEALVEAHSHQLLHGNLDPSKIRIVSSDDGSEVLKLTDFGMPPDPADSAHYLSPEQRLNAYKVQESSDIYALGCIMYEALVGSPPKIGLKSKNISLSYLHELASQHAKNSPEHDALKLLDCIIAKCLQQKTSARFKTVRELMKALALVTDCLVETKQRKVPRDVNKLFLFRFLDMFDKKITIGLTSLLLASSLAGRFYGEVELQRTIDQAEIQSIDNSGKSIQLWTKAIDDAKRLNKPSSLVAEMQWELANAYTRRSESGDSNAALSDDQQKAASQYELALAYYDKGLFNQANAMTLLEQEIEMLSYSMNDVEAEKNLRKATIAKLTKLTEQKRWDEIAKEGSEFIKNHSTDPQIAELTRDALMKKRSTKNRDERITELEKAVYYDVLSATGWGGDVTANYHNEDLEKELSGLIEEKGYNPTSYKTQTYLAIEALKHGQLEAAAGMFFVSGSSAGDEVCNYLKLRHDSVEKSKNYQLLIDPLNKWLTIAKKAYGPHSKHLEYNTLLLAKSYEALGEKKKALQAYAEWTECKSDGWTDPAAIISYANLALEQKQPEKARDLIVDSVFGVDGQISNHSLEILLIMMDQKTKHENELDFLVSDIADEAKNFKEPEFLIPARPVPAPKLPIGGISMADLTRIIPLHLTPRSLQGVKKAVKNSAKKDKNAAKKLTTPNNSVNDFESLNASPPSSQSRVPDRLLPE